MIGPLPPGWPDRCPQEVLDVLAEYRTAETTTVAADGTPVTWPLFPMFRADRGVFQLTTSVGFPEKAFNLRRDPRISLLFSNPTGTALIDPPAVLVQGSATCRDELVTDLEPFRHDFVRICRAQPISRFYGADPVTRRLVDWYFFRLVIDVVPTRVRWWPGGDMSVPPHEVEIADAT